MGRKPIISLVRSGGQTGTDRAALLAARKLKYPIAGWCPKGGWAEDMTQPPGLLKYFPEMTETPTSQIAQRTEWNVRDSHVTIVIGDPETSFGTSVTADLANAYERPYLIVDADDTPADVLKWLADVVGRGLTVNFAGPRESEAPGTQEHAVKFIFALLKANIADYRTHKDDADTAPDKGAFVKAYTAAKASGNKAKGGYAKKEEKDPFADLVFYDREPADAEPEPQVDAARQEAITAALFGTSAPSAAPAQQTAPQAAPAPDQFDPLEQFDQLESEPEPAATEPEPAPAKPEPSAAKPEPQPEPAAEKPAPKPKAEKPDLVQAMEEALSGSDEPAKPKVPAPKPKAEGEHKPARPPRPAGRPDSGTDKPAAPEPTAEESAAEGAPDEYEAPMPVSDDDYVDPFAEFL